MAKSVKINITVPVELAERLKAYRGAVNISAAATKGIEQQLDALDELAVIRMTRTAEWDSLIAEIARLRAEVDELKAAK